MRLATAALAAAILSTAVSSFAEVASPTVVRDPLMERIMSKQLVLAGGGVTGAVRIGSGEAIPLTVGDPLAPLKPAEGLAEKPVKAKARRKPRNVREQLKTLSDDERKADWAGRK